jgi:sec-independent protein translocase protein TatB
VFALILETLSSTELLFILVIALIFFGPRKLPQLARSMGKGLAEFRKASDDFKRTWEREVAMEAAKLDVESENAILPAPEPLDAAETYSEEARTAEPLVAPANPELFPEPANPDLVVARGAVPEPVAQTAEPLTAPAEAAAAPEPLRKQEWF